MGSYRQGLAWSMGPGLLVAVISLFALVLRLWHVEQWSFDLIEAQTFRALTQPLDAGSQGFFASPQAGYPFVFLLLRSLLDVGLLPGFHEGWIRLPFALAGCLLVPLLALWGHALFGRRVAYLAALLVAVHPAHVAASQTADPLVFGLTFAVAAAAAHAYGQRRAAWGLVLLAGISHPIAWLLGAWLLGAWLLGAYWSAPAAGRRLDHAARFAKPLKLVGWLLLLHLAFVVPTLLRVASLPLCLLTVVALAMRPRLVSNPKILNLLLMMLLPLFVGSVWWWFDASVADSASVAALPVMILLAAWLMVRLSRSLHTCLLRDGKASGLLRHLTVATPTVLLLGEVATATFLYFVADAGGRPPWRDLRPTILAPLTIGHRVEVIAGRGRDVLRVYLRPSHWREASALQPANLDPHPGVRVSGLPADLLAATELLEQPDATLVLQRDEWRKFRSTAGAAELLQDFVIVDVWPSPAASGDQSLYLLRRRAAN